jgi:hypothetical protein
MHSEWARSADFNSSTMGFEASPLAASAPLQSSLIRCSSLRIVVEGLSIDSSTNAWAGRESHKRREQQKRTLAQDRPKTTQNLMHEAFHYPGSWSPPHASFSPSSRLPRPSNRNGHRTGFHLRVGRPRTCETATVLRLRWANSYGFTGRGRLASRTLANSRHERTT